MKAYELALELDGLDPHSTSVAYHSKGQVLSALQRYEEALAANEAALRISPKNWHVLDSQAYYLKQLKRDEEALNVYEDIVRLNPESSRDHLNKGLTLERLNRYEEALEVYERALQLGYDDCIGTIHYHKSRILQHLGRIEESQQVYQKARELDISLQIARLQSDSFPMRIRTPSSLDLAVAEFGSELYYDV